MKSIKVAFATTHPSDASPFAAALKTVTEKFGEIVTLNFWCGGDFGGDNARNLENVADFMHFAEVADVAILDFIHEYPELTQFKNLLRTLNIGVFMISPDHKKTYHGPRKIEQKISEKMFDFLQYGVKPNFENFLLYLANIFGDAAYPVSDPVLPRWEGIYHPDFDSTPTLTEYIEKKINPSRPTIGVCFHQSRIQNDDTRVIDSLVREIEQQGANVLPVFFRGIQSGDTSAKSFDWILENYFMKDDKPLIDVMVSALFFSFCMSPSGLEVLASIKKLGVPIIKMILSNSTFEEWRDSPLGLSVTDISSQVAMPEFDGFLITVPACTMLITQTDPKTNGSIIKYEPIPERINKLVRLSLNWAKLRHIPNNKKRIALFFHNYPPRNDIIGQAFGLDTPVSAMKILRSLKEQNYLLENLPNDGQQLIEEVIAGLTNDRRWLNDQELARRAVDKIPSRQYAEWFSELPKDVQEKMVKDWGTPPGKLFNYDDKLLVAGIVKGNIFLAIQPSRGFTENADAVYHSPDLAMSHHYYAYYRWIRDVFKADVVIHLGTHGTLEWLPGKSVGLSGSCFPDVAISDLPNIYPYVITNPGEGAQAKRRSYCCIVDYLIPVMHNADIYEEMSELEVQLHEYYHAKIQDQGKLSVLQKLIWQKVILAKIDCDLKVSEVEAFADFNGFLERLHAYLHELSDTQIRDGLHILGEPPAGPRLEEFLVTLTRLSNGSVPSLRQSVAELKGYDYEALLANIGKLNVTGKTNGDIIKDLNALILELMRRFNAVDFKKQGIDTITVDVLGQSSPKVAVCLSYIADFLVPALESTTDELTNILSACMGHFIPPGPSGSITRGMANVLPTGRNFYSVDPRTLPSLASWRVGVSLGDALLGRYLKEEGKYPESVGFVLWAVPTMKTRGDDVAEILYLCGVRPVWEASSGRVTGLEVIPLEELKRPRIDVTVRISGLFRDTFPNLVHLLDEAVSLVVTLKESPEKNYITKHINAEISCRVAEGINAKKAQEEACYRIFGDQPTAYGCGVSRAIDSKNWKTQKDLSDIYISCGCYAYSRKIFGVPVPDQFKLRLSEINLTVKNEESRELDILDSDDWYDVHGGMINAVNQLGGKAPRSYCGDSSDPDRVTIRSTAEEICHVFRSRLLNPKYIQSLKRHGYRGAAELSRVPDFVLGWDATAEVIEDWMYADLAKKYVFDEDMQKWFNDVNPYALQNIVERLLEAIERGLWQASEEMKAQLQRLYLQVEGLIEDINDKK